MYLALDYGHMAACGMRVDAYKKAIARAVKPGSVVVDIGAGTGILSLLAVRAGAHRVHAIEPNPAVWLIPELAQENGCADRIVIHPCTSFEVDLPEKADVIISDLRGSMPLHGEHLATLRDAKDRLLKPCGVLLPTRDRLMVGAVEARELARALHRGVEGFTQHGFTARAARDLFVNAPISDGGELRANDILTDRVSWATIDYGAPTPSLESTVVLRSRRCGTAHGLALWFEATIAEDIVFENAPGTSVVYARTFLPFHEPIVLEEHDRLEVVLRADERGSRFAWDTRHVTGSDVTKASFRQATFLGMPTSPEALLRASSSHAPSLSARGERIRQIINLMDGVHSVDQIADDLAASSTSPRNALLDEVRDAVDRYAR